MNTASSYTYTTTPGQGLVGLSLGAQEGLSLGRAQVLGRGLIYPRPRDLQYLNACTAILREYFILSFKIAEYQDAKKFPCAVSPPGGFPHQGIDRTDPMQAT